MQSYSLITNPFTFTAYKITQDKQCKPSEFIFKHDTLNTQEKDDMTSKNDKSDSHELIKRTTKIKSYHKL